MRENLFNHFMPIRQLSAHYIMVKNKVTSINCYLQRSITCPREPAAPLQVTQSVMSEYQCMHVVVQDPSLVVCASHECLGLFLCGDIECLVVDALEAAFDHCVFLLLCLNNTLVQPDVLHAHPFSVDHNIARNSLC